jgi:hypothetical protein
LPRSAQAHYQDKSDPECDPVRLRCFSAELVDQPTQHLTTPDAAGRGGLLRRVGKLLRQALMRAAFHRVLLWVARTSFALNSGKLVAIVKQTAGDRFAFRRADRTSRWNEHAPLAEVNWLPCFQRRWILGPYGVSGLDIVSVVSWRVGPRRGQQVCSQTGQIPLHFCQILCISAKGISTR